VGDNSQAQFQGRKGPLGIIAGFLQGLVQAAPQVDGAEQGGDAAPRGALVVLAHIVLAVALGVLGGILGVLGLDVVKDRLKHQAATPVQEPAEVVLEIEGRSGGDGCREKTGGERGDLFAQAEARRRSQSEDGLQVLEDSSGHAEGQNARLSHGGGLSREGVGTAWPRWLQPSFS